MRRLLALDQSPKKWRAKGRDWEERRMRSSKRPAPPAVFVIEHSHWQFRDGCVDLGRAFIGGQIGKLVLVNICRAISGGLYGHLTAGALGFADQGQCRPKF